MSKFVIRCVKKSHKDIDLPHLVPVFVGRSHVTQIKDPRLSRKHVKLIANLSLRQVQCTLIGHNSLKVASQNKILKRNDTINLNPGDKIELLEGLYEHVIVLVTSTTPEMSVHKNHWSQALYASMQNKDLLVYEDDTVVIIKDKYPKAKHHFLVLPKEKMATLHDLTDIHLLEHMISLAKSKILNVHPGSKFKLGFHAVPSLAQVHMHVISQDFDSPCLKTKKHWNSFNTSYFIGSDQVLDMLKDQGQIQTEDCKDLLKKDLHCNQCSHKPKNIPDLKQHLKSHINTK